MTLQNVLRGAIRLVRLPMPGRACQVIAMNMASIKLAVEDGSVLAVENACTYHAVRKWLVGFIDEINSSEITSEICTPMSL